MKTMLQLLLDSSKLSIVEIAEKAFSGRFYTDRQIYKKWSGDNKVVAVTIRFTNAFTEIPESYDILIAISDKIRINSRIEILSMGIKDVEQFEFSSTEAFHNWINTYISHPEVPFFCKQEYTNACHDCDHLTEEKIPHPGGHSTASAIKYSCTKLFWVDDF